MNNFKLKWDLLRENRCPKCGKKIDPVLKFGMFHCSDIACLFQITPKRFTEIVNSPVRGYSGTQHYRPRDEEPE